MAPKRKRAATVTKQEDRPDVPVAESAPASTRDAPAKDTTDAIPDDERDPTWKDPPAKRTRGSSSATANSKHASTGAGDSPVKKQKKSNNQVSMPINGTADGTGEHGEAGTMRMDAPPPAGSVDPVGYHTNPPPTDRPVRVYADGVFDLFHLGHMRQLQQAKTAFPNTVLIVGVTGDRETHDRKGLTVMSGKERAESLRHCRWVDEVIEDCPWIITPEFLTRHELDYVAHDDIPYGASEGDDIYKPIKERGMFLVTQRTEGVSTTGIITKIVRDYEQYIARQLRRGTSRQELNVSWLKKNELELKRHVAELRDTIRANWLSTGHELGRELRQFWDRSRPSSPAPARAIGSSSAGATASRSSRRESSVRSPLSPTANTTTTTTTTGLSGTPSRGRGGNNDFATGYAMGLIGGVKGWMEGSQRRSLGDSRPQSPEESAEHSEEEDRRKARARQLSMDEEGIEHGEDAMHS